MKRLSLLLLMASLAGGAFAQDLDTVSFTDHLDQGSRGNDLGHQNWTGGNWGSSNPDGSEFEDYSGPDLDISITTSVRYINSWATDGTPESPVQNVSSMTNPDRSLPLPSISPNPHHTPGGDTAVVIGDDGGFNALFFGDTDDADYYVEVDMFCPVLNVGAGFEVAGVVARAARDNDPDLNEYTFNPDRAGSYSIFYDYQLQEVKAVKWTTGNTSSDIVVRDPATYTQFGQTVTGVTDGWHTLRISCEGDEITFSFDGNVIASVTDTEFAVGRPGLYYREADVPSAEERQGVFDNLRAGPAATSSVSDWKLY